MPERKKIIFVLPKALSYRLLEFKKISKFMDVEIVLGGDETSEYGRMGGKFDEKFPILPSRVFPFLGGFLFYQTGTFRKYLLARYDYFLIQGNIRYLDFWLILLANLFLRRSLLVHGQGIYKKGISPTILSKIVYRFVARSPLKYVAYCDFSKESLVKIGVNPKQILIFKNTLKLEMTTSSLRKRSASEDMGILFLGRVRHGSGLDWFLSNLHKAANREGMVVHIVGGGDQYDELKERYSDDKIRFHGPIFDEDEISKIASQCSVGLYPGNAGLSLVHYAALGLVPVFHNKSQLHEGPEFSFFTPEKDSFRFQQGNFRSLLFTLDKLKRNPDLHFDAQKNALSTYKFLNNNGFAEDLLDELL